MPNRLPRATSKDEPVIPTGRLWDMSCEMIERGQKFEVAPPLFMSQGPEGVTLGVMFPGVNVIPLKLVANETGGGFYAGSNLAGVAKLPSGTNTLSEPLTGMSVPTNRNVLVFNPPEDGQNTHDLSPASQPTYGAGLIVGQTTETPSRPIAMWLGGANDLRYARFITFAGDNLITAHPCNADATTIDLATTIYLMLTFPAGPSNRPPFGTFVANVDVLGYFPIPSGFAITLSGHVISGVLESFTQWPYASSVGQGPYCSVANSGTTAATIIWDWPTLHPIP